MHAASGHLRAARSPGFIHRNVLLASRHEGTDSFEARGSGGGQLSSGKCPWPGE
jgi:hypothetical protein